MVYRPGSFSKNFAWHGAGLSKLHSAIRSGFSSRLRPVSREEFRANSGISDPNLELIPINFFLFNSTADEGSFLAVDELVVQAVEQPHSELFDRLALFALHLSSVGRIPSGGALWARDFVMERLWEDGFWRRSELGPDRLDDFLCSSLDARLEVRTKCRSNYRHLFELAGYFRGRGDLIDNRDGPWLSSAMLLAWDRALLSGEPTESHEAAALVRIVGEKKICRLLGVPFDFAEQLAARLAPAYLQYGDIRRFDVEERRATPAIPAAMIAPPRQRARPRQLQEIARDVTVSEVARSRREVEQQLRNVALAAALKGTYGFRCMFCDSRICVSISPEQFYVEAAHIRPLGHPHNGPDRPENMLVLCPNCHVQFDAGTLTISLRSSTELRVEAKRANHPLHGRTVRLSGSHTLDAKYIDWHQDYWGVRHGPTPLQTTLDAKDR